MQIHTPPPPPDERQNQLYRVLDETLPLLYAGLVGYYRFTEVEAEAFQDTLCIWFHRLTRRATATPSAAELREHILFVACKYARSFQIARLRGAQLEDEVNVTLNRAPEEIAVELLGRVERSGLTV